MARASGGTTYPARTETYGSIDNYNSSTRAGLVYRRGSVTAGPPSARVRDRTAGVGRPPLRLGVVYDFRNPPDSGIPTPRLYEEILELLGSPSEEVGALSR